MKFFVYFLFFLYFLSGNIFFDQADKQIFLNKIKDKDINLAYISYRNVILNYFKDRSTEDIISYYKMHWGYVSRITIDDDYTFNYFYDTTKERLPEYKKHYSSFDLKENSYNDLDFNFKDSVSSGPTFMAGNVNYQSNDYTNYSFDLDIFANTPFSISFSHVFKRGSQAILDQTGLLNFIINRRLSIIMKEASFIYWLEGSNDTKDFASSLLVFMTDAINRLNLGNFPTKLILLDVKTKSKDSGFISSKVITDAEIVFNMVVTYNFLKNGLSDKNKQKIIKSLTFYQKFFLSKVSYDFFSEEERINLIKTIIAISLTIGDSKIASTFIDSFINGDNSIFWDGMKIYLDKYFDEYYLPKPNITDTIDSSYISFLNLIYFLEKNNYKLTSLFPKIINSYKLYQYFFPNGDLPGFLQNKTIDFNIASSFVKKISSLAFLNNNNNVLIDTSRILVNLSKNNDDFFRINTFLDLVHSFPIIEVDNTSFENEYIGRFYISDEDSDAAVLVGEGNTPNGDYTGLYAEFYKNGIVYSRDINFEDENVGKKVISHNTVVIDKKKPKTLNSYTPTLNAQEIYKNSLNIKGKNFYSNVNFVELRNVNQGGIEQRRLVAIIKKFGSDDSYFLDIFRNKTTKDGDYLINLLGNSGSSIVLENLGKKEINSIGVDASRDLVGDSSDLGYDLLLAPIATPKIVDEGFYELKQSYIYDNHKKGITNSRRTIHYYSFLKTDDIVQRSAFPSKVANIQSYSNEVSSIITARSGHDLWVNPFITIQSSFSIEVLDKENITAAGLQDIVYLSIQHRGQNSWSYIFSSPEVKNQTISLTNSSDWVRFNGVFGMIDREIGSLNSLYIEKGRSLYFNDDNIGEYSLSNQNTATMLLIENDDFIDISSTEDNTEVSIPNSKVSEFLGHFINDVAIFSYDRDSFKFEKIQNVDDFMNDLANTNIVSLDFKLINKGNYRVAILPKNITPDTKEEKKILFYINDQPVESDQAFFRKGKAKIRIELFFNYGIKEKTININGENILENKNFNVLEDTISSFIVETNSELINLDQDNYSFFISVSHSFGVDSRSIFIQNFNNKNIIVFPSPFNPSRGDSLTYLASENDSVLGVKVNYIIKTISGKIIKVLSKRNLKVTWDGKDRYGNLCSPGVYYLFREYIKDGEVNVKTGKFFLVNQ